MPAGAYDREAGSHAFRGMIEIGASPELAFDHVIDTTAAGADIMSTRLGVRRITLDEEHDATGHVAMILLQCKVTAQVEVNCSC
jgi:hypothetical protein